MVRRAVPCPRFFVPGGQGCKISLAEKLGSASGTAQRDYPYQFQVAMSETVRLQSLYCVEPPTARRRTL
jgi:hypothetical protein